MTWRELVKQSLTYFEENEQAFMWSIEGLDSENGYLDDALIHDMYEIDDYFCDVPVKKIMDAAIEGCDVEGNIFNPNRDYWYRDYWNGSLISTDEKDYSNYLDDTFIESLYSEFAEHVEHNWTLDEYTFPDAIVDIFEEYREEHGNIIGLE